jgi:TetR/AcrR family transcriptional regulator
MRPRSAAPRPVRRRGSGLQTRGEIVAAAERHFAERGFEATRLEDVATEVGIRRAAIFYYFRDKQELYAAVLDELLRDWTAALPSRGSAAERLEASLLGWIDYVARRPSLARLLLREAASFQPGEVSPFIEAASAAIEWFRAVIDEGVASGELAPRIGPHRFMSLRGAITVFHFAAMPWLSLNVPVETDLDEHKREILFVAHSMLGIEHREES